MVPPRGANQLLSLRLDAVPCRIKGIDDELVFGRGEEGGDIKGGLVVAAEVGCAELLSVDGAVPVDRAEVEEGARPRGGGGGGDGGESEWGRQGGRGRTWTTSPAPRCR